VAKDSLQGSKVVRPLDKPMVADDCKDILRSRERDIDAAELSEESSRSHRIGSNNGEDHNTGLPTLDGVNRVALDVQVREVRSLSVEVPFN
jgi:hypothetical protein